MAQVAAYRAEGHAARLAGPVPSISARIVSASAPLSLVPGRKPVRRDAAAERHPQRAVRRGPSPRDRRTRLLLEHFVRVARHERAAHSRLSMAI